MSVWLSDSRAGRRPPLTPPGHRQCCFSHPPLGSDPPLVYEEPRDFAVTQNAELVTTDRRRCPAVPADEEPNEGHGRGSQGPGCPGRIPGPSEVPAHLGAWAEAWRVEQGGQASQIVGVKQWRRELSEGRAAERPEREPQPSPAGPLGWLFAAVGAVGLIWTQKDRAQSNSSNREPSLWASA